MTSHDRRVIDLDDAEVLGDFVDELNQIREARGNSVFHTAGQPATHVNADEGNVEQGLAKLVLSLIELLRQLLEKQALRRMEAGGLDEDEIERLGTTFMKLEAKIEELKAVFDLEGEDLNIDLGPLGKLLEDRTVRTSR